MWVYPNAKAASSSATINNITKNAQHTIVYNRSGITVDGGDKLSMNIVDGNTNTNNIAIFKSGTTRGAASNLRIYYFKIKDGTSLIRDFVPVLAPDKTAGKTGVVPAMLDQVNNQVYYNSGTGSFTAGPAVN